MITLRNRLKREYRLYLAVIGIAICVGAFSIAFFLNGAPREAMGIWLLTVILTVVMLVGTIFFGYVFRKNRVEFDNNSIHIINAFKETKIVKWHEIAAIKGSVDGFVIYGHNNDPLLAITPGMTNYELFYKLLREKCGQRFEDYNEPTINQKKQVLKINPAYSVIAVCGIVVFALYTFMLLRTPGEFANLIMDDSLGLFEKLFAPILGLFSVIFLIVALRRKVYYSKNGIIICPLFGYRTEIAWRDLSKLEVCAIKTSSGTVIKKLIFYTKHNGKYVINTMGFRGTEQYEEFLRLMLERKDFYKIALKQI